GKRSWLFCCWACWSRIAVKLALPPPKPICTVLATFPGLAAATATALAQPHSSRQRRARGGDGSAACSCAGRPPAAARSSLPPQRRGPGPEAQLLLVHRPPLAHQLQHLPRLGLRLLRTSSCMVIAFGSSYPMVDLASRYECAAVILHSPLRCGLRVAFPDTRKTHGFDAFPSIDRYLKSPLPYFRGTQDEVMAMYELLYIQYLESLREFISHKLPNSLI
ncbi:hypothetical protein FD754_016788, partial [Muntiacus muntjak]